MTARAIFAPEREWLVVLAVAPALAFPQSGPWVVCCALVVVAAFLVGEWVTGNLRWPDSPLAWPVAILFAMLFAGWILSPLRDAGVAKMLGIVLGVLTWRAVLMVATTDQRVAWAVALYVLAGAVVLVTAFAAATFKSKVWLFELGLRYRVVTLPGAEEGVNPNALGGTSLFFFPLLVLLAWRTVPSPFPGPTLAAAIRAGVLLLLSLVTLALFLSQSRTAWAAAVASLAVTWMLQFKTTVRITPLLLLAVTATALVGVVWPNTNVIALGTLTPRVHIWEKAIATIVEHPIFGIGLNAFRAVAAERYPELLREAGVYFSIDIAHAHNIFLETALAAGLPGLVAYLALLTVATMVCLRAAAATDAPRRRALVLGLWSSLVAVHVFGLIDAIPLGSKVGLFLWWNLGLIGAASRIEPPPHMVPPPQPS
jgi:putative inorganic carbon (HCO3(-)) transporter